MGVVYRATQAFPIARDVALKLVRRGFDTDRVVSRFETERQVLARMDHPGIARVYDAGAAPDGRPYFVMELVAGQPITTYADKARLSVRDRVALLRQVCLAVQHAHQKGVIHRDLKPANVLAARRDDGHDVKVIDFGIGDGHRRHDTLLTHDGQPSGLPTICRPSRRASSTTSIRAPTLRAGRGAYGCSPGGSHELPGQRPQTSSGSSTRPKPIAPALP
jgi:non-specific serine/threonine protein kinase/serine/threonine-protein kinase